MLKQLSRKLRKKPTVSGATVPRLRVCEPRWVVFAETGQMRQLQSLALMMNTSETMLVVVGKQPHIEVDESIWWHVERVKQLVSMRDDVGLAKVGDALITLFKALPAIAMPMRKNTKILIAALILTPSLSMGSAYYQLHSEATALEYGMIVANWPLAEPKERERVKSTLEASGSLTSQQAIQLANAIRDAAGVQAFPSELRLTDKQAYKSELQQLLNTP